jgi:hypothetical protein
MTASSRESEQAVAQPLNRFRRISGIQVCALDKVAGLRRYHGGKPLILMANKTEAEMHLIEHEHLGKAPQQYGSISPEAAAPNGIYSQARWDLRYRHFRCVDGWEGIEH